MDVVFDFVIFGRLSESSLPVAVMILLLNGLAEAVIFILYCTVFSVEDSLLESGEQNDLLAKDYLVIFLARQT